MKGFKQCDKGHFYKEAIASCPYCPKGATDTPKTEILGGSETIKSTSNDTVDTQKTQVYASGGANNSNEKTKPIPTSNQMDQFDATKTMIHGAGSSENNNDNVQIQRRKLRGWLVSFDIEKFGMDYRIVEGRNVIGSNASSDVTIQDNEVSSLHSLILCKKDKFIITDELSSNGTKLNGEELTPRDPAELNDGDEIKVGSTTLLFKTAFKN